MKASSATMITRLPLAFRYGAAAAIAIGGVAAGAAVFGGERGIASADPSPSATPREVNEDLLEIVVPGATVPPRLTVYRALTGMTALFASDTAPTDSPGFVDARLTSLDADDEHEGAHEDRYQTFAALFATVADAERAFDAAVANHESPDGWDLSTSNEVDGIRAGYDPDPGLGDESVLYVKGTDYGHPRLSVYLWRVDNVLLQAVDFHPYDRPGLLESIARQMDARTGKQ